MNIEINTENLAVDIAVMKSRKDDLVRAKTLMFQCIENLNGMWSGAAHDAFVQATAVDATTIEALIDSIEHLISCMENARGKYDTCQDTVNGLIQSIRLSGT